MPGRGSSPAGRAGGMRSWSSGPSSGEFSCDLLWHLGRVSLLNHSADESDAAVSFVAFIPPRLLCFPCPLCPWIMGTHRREG